VFKNVIPLGSIQLTVECGDQPDRVYNYNANNGVFDFKWDRRCGDGNLAPSGTYTVVLEACDIYHNCDEARGKVNIPFAAPIMPTSTPMPTLEKTEVVQQWYSNPTSIPSATPTPQTSVLPVLPMTGSQTAPDDEIPSGNNQPLLPLAAAALGTSVLLAASSRKEEEEESSETPVNVSSLSALAGIVKTGFDGIWNEAERISAADASTEKSRRTYYVGVEDPQEALRRQKELAALVAAQSVKTTTSTGNTSGKVAKTTSPTSSYSYQDILYGNGTTKGVMGTSMGYTSHGQAKTASVSNVKSTSSSKPSAAKNNNGSTAKSTSSSSGGLLGWISNTAKSVENSVKSTVTSTINKVVNTVKSTASTVRDTVSSFVKDPVTTIKNVASSVKNTVTSAASSVANTVKNTASAVNNAVTTFISNPKTTIQNIASAVQTTVNNVATNVNSAVTNTVNSVVNKVNTTKTNVVNTINAASITAGIVASAVAEEVEDGATQYIDNQIDNTKETIAFTYNSLAWLFGSFTDPTVNPYLTYASTVTTPALINTAKDSLHAWGDVYSMLGIIRNYTFTAFAESRWEDGFRGLVGILEGNLAVGKTPLMAGEIIADGIIAWPEHLVKTATQFNTSIKDLLAGKQNYGDVYYTMVTFAADALPVVGILSPGGILDTAAQGSILDSEAIAARALAMAGESEAEGTAVRVAEIAAEAGSEAAVVEGMEAAAARAAEGTAGEIETITESVLNSTDDVVKGAGELSEAEIIAQKQAIADAAAQNYNYKYKPAAERAKLKGYDGIGTTSNGGATFQGSDWMYPVEEGQSNVVKIKATGNRENDFKLAYEQAGIENKPIDAVWHHVDDFNVETGEMTLELVYKKAHDAIIPHSGSCAQYDAVNGPTYNK
jgi:hypothetical protein